ncbi:hypothetical protein RN001_005283 [Aquatica leii]|uniref:Uncharacterized protein n=1 Tax=Aquatica leii TaxID=1421715 RepID=A0AAN7PCB0_9COLE|nr:hypothetical protein RN001_005283 [Aquatica leii]
MKFLGVKSLINVVKKDVKENSNLMERFVMQSKRQWETINLSLTYNTDQRIITPVNDLKILNETLFFLSTD